MSRYSVFGSPHIAPVDAVSARGRDGRAHRGEAWPGLVAAPLIEVSRRPEWSDGVLGGSAVTLSQAATLAIDRHVAAHSLIVLPDGSKGTSTPGVSTTLRT